MRSWALYLLFFVSLAYAGKGRGPHYQTRLIFSECYRLKDDLKAYCGEELKILCKTKSKFLEKSSKRCLKSRKKFVEKLSDNHFRNSYKFSLIGYFTF